MYASIGLNVIFDWELRRDLFYAGEIIHKLVIPRRTWRSVRRPLNTQKEVAERYELRPAYAQSILYLYIYTVLWHS